jgi:hypothetical protein
MRALLLSSLLFLGCANTTGYIITGRSLNTVGEAFVEVAEAYNKGALQGTISEAQYEKWAEFGAKFQATYPAAVQLWKVSVLANDLALRNDTDKVLASLITELISFATQVGVTVQVLK